MPLLFGRKFIFAPRTTAVAVSLLALGSALTAVVAQMADTTPPAATLTAPAVNVKSTPPRCPTGWFCRRKN